MSMMLKFLLPLRKRIDKGENDPALLQEYEGLLKDHSRIINVPYEKIKQEINAVSSSKIEGSCRGGQKEALRIGLGKSLPNKHFMESSQTFETKYEKPYKHGPTMFDLVDGIHKMVSGNHTAVIPEQLLLNEYEKEIIYDLVQDLMSWAKTSYIKDTTTFGNLFIRNKLESTPKHNFSPFLIKNPFQIVWGGSYRDK